MSQNSYLVDWESVEIAPLPLNISPNSPSFIQQDLYFGSDLPGGNRVSNEEFQAFVDEVIAPRTEGLTQFAVRGQVRNSDGSINKERANLITLLQEDTPENRAIASEVLDAYKERFNGAFIQQVINPDDLTVSFNVTDDLIDNDPIPELIQVDLYLGRNISSGGQVSEREFSQFLDNFVTPRFTGLTVFDARGQFLDDTGSIVTESTKVLTLLIEDTQDNETALKEVIEAYLKEFQQQSTLQTINEDIKVSFGPAEDLIDNDATPELIQVDLYFGLSVPGIGEISSGEFQEFVDDIIAPNFTTLTQFEARGQVRDASGSILKENSQLISLILEDTVANEDAINNILRTYQTHYGAGTLVVIDEEIATTFSRGTTSVSGSSTMFHLNDDAFALDAS
ncbi:DUF3574 domain-containing protein [Scytonema sp. UIC 10036]|uniref:DUF3574 domain-containing protein n=1 Tax=Scytonema sp. UIC 10036 TaxID=2304196 RepID=UPI0012DA5853|nr:DUF3574 domain-containing protein [Scytonema sp. UIC 10036]MUG99273.1 DUF3574 domain-containing protein [Scytonema sp. UIC 10036]